MRARQLLFFTSAAIALAGPATAADQLKFGKAPAWVVSQAIPTPSAQGNSTPSLVLLNDQQMELEPGKVTSYVELAIKIQTPEGLGSGNISIPWDPATQTVTVNKLEIHRGKQVIDVLSSGQTFTTIRRESNLELAMFDGVLTANIQPEGLQEGDVIVLATTTEYSDPVLKDHTAASFAYWNDTPVQLAHARLQWPDNIKLVIRQTPALPCPALPAIKINERDGKHSVELTLRDIQPLTPPANAPARFAVGRLGEASDFQSWAEVADLMLPLYRDAAVIPPTGHLHDEVENIRLATTDPRERAAKALNLVQSRVRYVALLMGQGSYVPATAPTTWSRRYGDCKAKTALLLGVLHSLGIEADPVLVNTEKGDAIADRLPMLAYFNHVLVRASIAGKEYWLDGTRTGDAAIDGIQVPNFGWALPIVSNAKLVRVVTPPFANPVSEAAIDMDASGGVKAPVPTTIELVLRGDLGRAVYQMYSAVPRAKLDELLRQQWKKEYSFVTIASSNFTFDKAKGELRQAVKGEVKMDWRDSWFTVPGSSIAFDPDFERADGPQHDAPFAMSYPSFRVHHVKVRLPAGFAAEQKLPAQVKETLAGTTYERSASFLGDTLIIESSEKAFVPEVPYKDAVAAKARLRSLWRDDVYLRMPAHYRGTTADLTAATRDEPTSSQGFVDRGLLYLNNAKYDEAIADFTKASQLNPSDPWSLANRAVSYAWKGDFAAARKDIAAAEAVDPKNIVVIRGKGLMAELKGDHASALGAYSAALTIDSKDDFSLLHRAIAQIALGDLAAAEADLDRYDALRPGQIDSARTRAEIDRLRGDAKSAVSRFSKLLVSRPTDAWSLAHRSMALENLGDYDPALADALLAMKGGFSKFEMRELRARIFIKKGERNKAAAEADLLIKDLGHLAVTHVNAGQIYDSAGMKERAMQEFARALAIEPAPYIYVLRAYVRPATHHADRLADFEAALRLDANDKGALLSSGEELSRMGKFAEALPFYDRAIKAYPDAKSLTFTRALVLGKLGQITEAEKVIAKYREGLKTAVEFNNLCWGKATANLMLESAIADCKEAVRLAPAEAAFIDSLGMAFLRLKRFNESIDAYSRAITQRPMSAESLMGRALAYAGKGEMVLARADAKAARAISPDIDETFAGYGLKFEDQKALTSK